MVFEMRKIKGEIKIPGKTPRVKGQKVVLKKKTTIKAFTPEEELDYLVARGDWELVVTSQAFLKRSPEGQVQILRKAIDNRIKQLEETLNYLINLGPEERAAAMGVLARMQDLRKRRNGFLKRFYEQAGQRRLPKKGGIKIDFW